VGGGVGGGVFFVEGGGGGVFLSLFKLVGVFGCFGVFPFGWGFRWGGVLRWLCFFFFFQFGGGFIGGVGVGGRGWRFFFCRFICGGTGWGLWCCFRSRGFFRVGLGALFLCWGVGGGGVLYVFCPGGMRGGVGGVASSLLVFGWFFFLGLAQFLLVCCSLVSLLAVLVLECWVVSFLGWRFVIVWVVRGDWRFT